MPTTSHLEGVGNYLAARAATTFIHYTPPPFIALIVHRISSAVKLFLKIRLQQAPSTHIYAGFSSNVKRYIFL